MNKTQLITPVSGDIIFGYPPTLPQRAELVLGGKIYETQPCGTFHQNACKTWAKVKRKFTRTGVRASKKA